MKQVAWAGYGYLYGRDMTCRHSFDERTLKIGCKLGQKGDMVKSLGNRL